ncbi:MAG: response regulator transcription factor [Acidobacteria bacterium]|nr:response regulator transcription factor [Acidobacteriota bacterium]
MTTAAAHVLVVEDDVTMSDVVRRVLEEDGYRVSVSGTGIDALILAKSNDFDVATIDAMLPEMSGFELCKHLRQQGFVFPIMMLTARDSVDDRVRGLDAGADDYLIKPFAFAELSARVRAMVRRNAVATPSATEFGQLHVDAGTGRISLNGSQLSLSTREYAVLRLMISLGDEAVPRERILADVWGTTHIDPNIVDQYVRYLRRKLDGSEIAIETIRGTGYRLKRIVP